MNGVNTARASLQSQAVSAACKINLQEPEFFLGYLAVQNDNKYTGDELSQRL